MIQRTLTYIRQLLKDEEVRLRRDGWPGFRSQQEIREFVLGMQSQINDHVVEMNQQAVNSNYPDVHDMEDGATSQQRISNDEKAAIQAAIQEFEQDHGFSSEVKILNKTDFDRIKNEYKNNEYAPEKDVVVLMARGPDGKMEQAFVTKDAVLPLKTQKTSEITGEQITLTGTREEINGVRDNLIDKAIDNEVLEGFEDIDPDETPFLNIFKRGLLVLKVLNEFLDNLKVNEPHWNNDLDDNTWPFWVPEYIAGPVNVGVDEIKSLPELAQTLGSFLFDKEMREKLVTAVENITWETVTQGLKGMFQSKVDQYEDPNQEVVTYHASSDAAVILAAILTGGKKFLENVDDFFSSFRKLGKQDWKRINLPDLKAKKLGEDMTTTPER